MLTLDLHDPVLSVVWTMLDGLESGRPPAWRDSLARHVLRSAEGEAGDEETRMLADEISDRVPDLRLALGLEGLLVDAKGTPLDLDRRLARHLARFGKAARIPAREYGEQAEDRASAAAADDNSALWLGWLDPDHEFGSPALARWAWSVWVCYVRPRHDRARLNPPALPFDTFSDLTATLNRGGRFVLASPGKGSLRGRYYEHLADLDAGRVDSAVVDRGALDAIVTRGGKLLGRPYAILLVAFIVRSVHQAWAYGSLDSRVIRVVGGSAALAREIGAGEGHSAAQAVWDALLALACVGDFGSAGHGALIDITVKPEAPGHPREVLLTALPCLCPYGVFDARRQGRHLAALESRRLVPVPDLRLVPIAPRALRADRGGSVLGLALRLVAEIRARAREVVREGGARLDPARLARQVDLDGPLAADVIEVLQAGLPPRPPFVVRDGRRWLLGPAHGQAMDSIRRAGEEGERQAARARRKRRGQP